MEVNPSVCEEENYNTVYRRNVEKLRNYLYYRCKDLDMAEDLTQEAFIRLWNKCKDVIFNKVTSFLYTVARNLFLDHTRKEKAVLRFVKEQAPPVDKQDPYYLLRTEEFREQIERNISDLPDGQREVFLMNRIDKLTYKEIAGLLEISQTAVEKRMSKALLKLRDNIEEFKTYGI